MYKKNYLCIFKICLIFFVLIFSSCKTVPKFSEDTEFCGLLIDENNHPVEGVFVLMKKGGILKNTYTNNRGIFVIEDIQSGFYDFVFEKNEYEITKIKDVLFSDRKKVFCFQINSKEKIFAKIDSFFLGQQFEKGISLLGNLKIDVHSKLYNLCCLYKSYGFYKMGDIKKARIELERLGKKKNCSFDYSSLEKKLEGK